MLTLKQRSHSWCASLPPAAQLDSAKLSAYHDLGQLLQALDLVATGSSSAKQTRSDFNQLIETAIKAVKAAIKAEGPGALSKPHILSSFADGLEQTIKSLVSKVSRAPEGSTACCGRSIPPTACQLTAAANAALRTS